MNWKFAWIVSNAFFFALATVASAKWRSESSKRGLLTLLFLMEPDVSP